MSTNALVPLATYTFGASEFEVTFSSIPTDYKDLRLVFSGAGATNATNNIALQYNGVASGYILFQMYGGGSTEGQGYATARGQVNLNTTIFFYNLAGVSIVDIMDYSATDKDTMTMTHTNITGTATQLLATRTNFQTAITSIRLFLSGGSTYFLSGSQASLYGVVG